ncbi:MAG: class I SAM-dependent methyltransferase [Nitrococcus sp.]|nr:class I SAM-dependent methyltransferase [Nitrococcus sp.]
MKNGTNKISLERRKLRDVLRIQEPEDFHNYLLDDALQSYTLRCAELGRGLGSALAICANFREARALSALPFDHILLTGIDDRKLELQEVLDGDPRVTYEQHNSERLSIAARSFDLVICKEGLHHLARPVLGMYEMLRLTRDAVIIIEPFDTFLGNVLEILGMSSVYEQAPPGNVDSRPNYVYRWSRRSLAAILNSYYLESGYSLNLTLGWMSVRVNAHKLKAVRVLSAYSGWVASFIPGSRGNYMSAFITAGSDIPRDPEPVAQECAETRSVVPVRA